MACVSQPRGWNRRDSPDNRSNLLKSRLPKSRGSHVVLSVLGRPSTQAQVLDLNRMLRKLVHGRQAQESDRGGRSGFFLSDRLWVLLWVRDRRHPLRFMSASLKAILTLESDSPAHRRCHNMLRRYRRRFAVVFCRLCLENLIARSVLATQFQF